MEKNQENVGKYRKMYKVMVLTIKFGGTFSAPSLSPASVPAAPSKSRKVSGRFLIN
jgi:hypothetical protein